MNTFWTYLTLFVTLPISIMAMYGTGTGIVLLTSDQKTQSGVLSSTHKCSNFPKEFKAAHVKNTGSSHCALWTDANCQGTLYVVPAHYTMKIPRDEFESVIC
jgi:hypothetical protein